MEYQTYCSGMIFLKDISTQNKKQIFELINQSPFKEIFKDEGLHISVKGNIVNQKQQFDRLLYEIAKLLPPQNKGNILCRGLEDNDRYEFLIENNKLYTQFYELVPKGEPVEFKIKKTLKAPH